MRNIGDKLRLDYLKLKRKILNLTKSRLVQWISGVDITFVFLFFALYLFGYQWKWEVLLASLGLWLVIKEGFKLIKKSIIIKRGID